MNNLVRVDAAVVTSPLTLPRLSAKRGGHGTEKVGCPKNGKTLGILYNACDARSQMTPGADGVAEAADVTAELEAILAVGTALARLQNPAGRQRVLNWAVQRFDAVPAGAADEAVENVAAPVALTSDPALVVGDLTDLFDDSSRAALRASDGLDDPLDSLFDLPAVDLLAAPLHEETPSVARHRVRLKVLVHHFVNAFRRFTLDARSPEIVSVIGRT